MSKTIDETRIADAAYHLWEKEGRPQGKDLDLWLKAQSELEAAQPGTKKRRATAKPKAAAAEKPKAAAKPKAKAPAKPRTKAAKS